MNQGIITASARGTQRIGRELAQHLRPGTAVFLEGDLGSGKTTFVKGLVEGLGFKHPEEVKSPTFVLMHVYQARIPVYHFDLYRLESEKELEALGFDEFLRDPAGISCVEWAEKAGSYQLKQSLAVHFKILGPTRRKIVIDKRG